GDKEKHPTGEQRVKTPTRMPSSASTGSAYSEDVQASGKGRSKTPTRMPSSASTGSGYNGDNNPSVERRSKTPTRMPSSASTGSGNGSAYSEAQARPKTPTGSPSAASTSSGSSSLQDDLLEDDAALEEVHQSFFRAKGRRFLEKAMKGFSKLVGGGVGAVNILGGEYRDVGAMYAVQMDKELGSGQFGVTRVAVCRATGEKFACKTINKAALKSKSDEDDVRREVTIMEMVKTHPKVVKLKEVFENEQAIHLIMELCSGGELFDRIKERRRYSEREAALVMRAVLGVLQSCHQRHHVLHRDIKPENILLAHPSSPTDVRVIDFGISTILKPGSKPLSDFVGSLYYIAPEVIEGSYGFPADVWSAGVVLYVLLAGVPPFWAKTEADVTKAIREGKWGFRGAVWRNVSEPGKDLICQLLTHNQKKRITARAALDHPWLLKHKDWIIKDGSHCLGPLPSMTAEVASMSAVASLGVTVKSASTSAISEGSAYTEDAVSTPITGGIPEGWPVNASTEMPPHLAADAAAADPVVRFTVAEQVKKGEDFHMALANYRLGGVNCGVYCVFDGHNGTAAAMHCKKELLGFVSEYLPGGSSYREEAGEKGEEAEVTSKRRDGEGADVPASGGDGDGGGGGGGGEGGGGGGVGSKEAWLKALPMALAEGFLKCHNTFALRGQPSGATATVAIVSGWTVTVAAVGDSRAILDTTGGGVTPLSLDHRFEVSEDECNRVLKEGGQLARLRTFDGTQLGPLRSWPGGLCVSRSIGDVDCGTFITPLPHVKQIQVPQDGGRVVMASDGLWDAVDSDKAARRCRGLPCTAAAPLLVKESIKAKGLRDDITVLVVDLLTASAAADPSACPVPKPPGSKSFFAKFGSKSYSSYLSKSKKPSSLPPSTPTPSTAPRNPWDQRVPFIMNDHDSIRGGDLFERYQNSSVHSAGNFCAVCGQQIDNSENAEASVRAGNRMCSRHAKCG
ncbi:unnamed protein product, partial [Closterium sp. Yama58-4]